MMTWMDRYLYAVTKRLPKAMREDIEKELRSNLLDALDEKLEGRDPTEQDMINLLNEFGDPEKVASEYMPENRFLIGPELIDLYWMILKIAGAAVALGLTIALVISVIQGQGDPAQKGLIEIIAGYFGTIWSAVISMVGTVTIIFAIIQRTTSGETPGRSNAKEELRQVGKEIKDAFGDAKTSGVGNMKKSKSEKSQKQPSTWSAEQLPSIPVSADRVNLSESIFSLVFIGIAILIFNVYPDKIGAYFFDDAAAKWVGIPLFNLVVFSAYILFFNLVWILEALLHVRLIQKGRWGFAERLFQIFISLAGLAIFIALIQNPAVFNTEGIKTALNQFGVDLSGIAKLGVLNLKVLMVIVILGTAAEVIKQAYYAVKSKVDAS